MSEQKAPPSPKKTKVLVLWNGGDPLAMVNLEQTSESPDPDAAPPDDSDSGDSLLEPVVPAEDEDHAEEVGFFDDAPTQVLSGREQAAAVADGASPVPAQLSGEHQSIADALRRAGYNVVAVNLEDDIDRLVHALVVHRPAFVFNLVDEIYHDNTLQGAVAGLFDLYGYSYTGSDPLCLSTTQDRTRIRLMMADAELPAPSFAIVRDVNAIPDTAHLRRPVIVSQAFDDTYETEGYSGGVWSREELEERTRSLSASYDMPFLIEEFIDGRHVQALLVGNRVLEVLPLVERIYNHETGDEDIILAQLGTETLGRVRQLARRAFRVAGCRDVAQIDFCIDRNGAPWIIDIRPFFDMGLRSPFEIAADHSEYGYDGVIELLAKEAEKRARELEGHSTSQVEAHK